MSRNASEAFRDPLPAVAAARAAGGAAPAVFVALTDDGALREAIDAAVSGRGSVVVTTTPEAFADQLVAQAAGIAIIDLACAPTSAPIFIERLHEQFPGLVLIAAGAAREQNALVPLVTDGTVCRFAHKPVSSQRLALFLDAALRRRAALASAAREHADTPSNPTRPRGTRATLLILLFAAAAATAAWLLDRPAAPPAPEAARDAAPDATLVVAPALAAHIDIPGDIALAGLALEPGAPAAAGTDDAVAQARHEVELARRLMDVGLLIDPPGNSARSHVTAAVRLAPQDPEVRRAARALGAQLVTATRNALLAHDAAKSERLLRAARNYGVNAATVAELEEQLDMLQGMMSP